MSDPLKTLKVGSSTYEIYDEVARTTKQNTLVSGTNIKTINGDSILGSGDISISGGDTVTVRQTLTSGTEIGGVAVNGTETKLYAPTPPTKTSELLNDSDFVSDPNYVHTTNDYTNNDAATVLTISGNPTSQNVTVGNANNATWTATGSGIVTVVGRASAANSHVYVRDTTAGTYVLMIQTTTNGQYGSASFFAVKGHVYTTTLSNWNTSTRIFYKIFN